MTEVPFSLTLHLEKDQREGHLGLEGGNRKDEKHASSVCMLHAGTIENLLDSVDSLTLPWLSTPIFCRGIIRVVCALYNCNSSPFTAHTERSQRKDFLGPEGRMRNMGTLEDLFSNQQQQCTNSRFSRLTLTCGLIVGVLLLLSSRPERSQRACSFGTLRPEGRVRN